jgi:hypothetical protein
MKTIIFHHFSYISLKQILLYQTWILQKKKKKPCRKIFDDVGQCAVFGINSLTKDARHKWTFLQVKSNCLETAKTILCLQYNV